MKYYSEKLNKLFESEEECNKAEAEHDAQVREEEERKTKLANERKARAKEVEAAAKSVMEARKAYDELLARFIKDYGSFHATISSNGDFFDLFESLFRF